MEASAQLTAGVVDVTLESIVLGSTSFRPDEVRGARIWTLRRSRNLWVFLPVLVAAIIYATGRMLWGGGFDLTQIFDFSDIALTGLLTLVLLVVGWVISDTVSADVYIVEVKTASARTGSWATLDESAANDVKTAIERAAKGDLVSLHITATPQHEGDLLLFGRDSYPLSQVSSVSTGKRQADRAIDAGYMLLGATLIALALLGVVDFLKSRDASVKWLYDTLVVVSLVLGVPAFGFLIFRRFDRTTRSVYIVKIAGTFGARPVFATLDQEEADAIVAEINNAIAPAGASSRAV